MGIVGITGLEILTNPYDLEFVVSERKEIKLFGYGIFRGPGHRYKPLITAQPFAQTAEKAIEHLKQLLSDICEGAAAELKDKNSVAAAFVNPSGGDLPEDQILNAGLIDRIITELRTKNAVSTCEMGVPA